MAAWLLLLLSGNTLAAAVAAAAASAAATDLLHEAINDVTILHAHLQKTQGKAQHSNTSMSESSDTKTAITDSLSVCMAWGLHACRHAAASEG
jgi:hypothetical protein